MLDSHLSQGTRAITAKQHRLAIFLEAGKVQKQRFEGATTISRTIDRIMEEPATISLLNHRARRHSILQSQSSAIRQSCALDLAESWRQLLSVEPVFYLRLVSTLDHAFSKERYPDEADLPEVIRATRETRRSQTDAHNSISIASYAFLQSSENLSTSSPMVADSNAVNTLGYINTLSWTNDFEDGFSSYDFGDFDLADIPRGL